MSEQNNDVMETKELTPSEYFDLIKGRKEIITDEILKKVYDNALILLNKFNITGQTKAMKKLIFHLDCISAEREIVKLGINTVIYRDDIEEFIDNVSKETVKLIDLESYERDIPDEIVDVIRKVGDKFDKLYILYTDYTIGLAKAIEKERQEKDPILFGTFENKETGTVIDRFYFLGDWEDEYCDLTLDKMVSQFQNKNGRDIQITISTPEDIEELKEQLHFFDYNNIKERYVINKSKKKGFFGNIRMPWNKNGEKK